MAAVFPCPVFRRPSRFAALSSAQRDDDSLNDDVAGVRARVGEGWGARRLRAGRRRTAAADGAAAGAIGQER